jgi:hypothetical protein
LDILECIAWIIKQLHGPWLLAADFNFPPDELEQSGWLKLVGGQIQAPELPTCNSSVYDYFVIDKRLGNSVLGVAAVEGTGSKPHSAVRLWMQGKPRRHSVRVLARTAKAGPSLPRGCLPETSGKGFEDIAPLVDIDSADVATLDDSYIRWIAQIEAQIADMQGPEGPSRKRICCRAAGPRMIMQPALGKPGTGTMKVSVITVAWRTITGWLVDVLKAFTARAPPRSCLVLANALDCSGVTIGHIWVKADMPLQFAGGCFTSHPQCWPTECS